MDLFQILNLAKQSSFVDSLRASHCSGDSPSGVRSGEEKVADAVVVEEADEDNWDFNGVKTADVADGFEH